MSGPTKLHLPRFALAVVSVSLIGVGACATDEGTLDSGIGRDAGRDAVVELDTPNTVTDVPNAERNVPDAQCEAPPTMMATVERKPVDILLYIDSSSSMRAGRQGIAMVLNGNLLMPLETAMVDYKLHIMTQGITLDPAVMMNPRVQLYNVASGSGQALPTLLQALPMVLPNLRMGAFKVIVHATDAASGQGAGAGTSFDTSLLAMYPMVFGTAMMRNYTFHSLAGFGANMPASVPWPPEAPLVSTRCSAAGLNTGTGVGFQELAKLTGGLRYPVCDYPGYTNVISAIAAGSVRVSRVPCSFAYPLPMGSSYQLRMKITTSDGMSRTYDQARDMMDCGAMRGFYRMGDRVALCPDACGLVQMDLNARIEWLPFCGPG
jgi:hypothetical protein